MARDEDPSYEEILDENYDLHEEQKRLLDRIQGLENDLTEERTADRDNERRAIEIERLQIIASQARTEAAERKRENEQHGEERETWARERGRLETTLREKEERLEFTPKCRQTTVRTQVVIFIARHNTSWR
jgi:hypothetical protein